MNPELHARTAVELVDAGRRRRLVALAGYLDQPFEERLKALPSEVDVPLTYYHTSGHAYVKDPQRLVEAFDSARVVPNHSEATDRFADHFPRVEPACRPWWNV